MKDEVVFLCFSDFNIVVQKEWLATDSQNVILNNFEEYYIYSEKSFAFTFLRGELIIFTAGGPTD